MGNFIGVWKLDEPIYCQKEISGKRFRTIIAGVPVVIASQVFPMHMMERVRLFLRVI